MASDILDDHQGNRGTHGSCVSRERIYLPKKLGEWLVENFSIDLDTPDRPFLFVTDDDWRSFSGPISLSYGLHDVSVAGLSNAGADWVIPIILAAQPRGDTAGAVEEILRIHGENEAKRKAQAP